MKKERNEETGGMSTPVGRSGRIDLHVHSCYSDKPSLWFHKWLGAGECYTPVAEVYRLAKARGMDVVTLTDHDTMDGAFELNRLHPSDTLPGVEVTTWWPEGKAMAHVLVWGARPEQFSEIQKARSDIYPLVEYLRREKLAHALAHPTFSMDGRLTLEHLEKSLLLFNLFEGINGGRSTASNRVWQQVVANLDEDRIEDLRVRHRLEPFGGTPWLKALTGGSDDHAGIFIGRTFTRFPGTTPAEVLSALRAGTVGPEGDSSTHLTYAFGAMKIAHHFASSRKGRYLEGPVGQAAHYFFTNEKITLAGRFKLGKAISKLKQKPNGVNLALVDVLRNLKETHGREVHEKMVSCHDALGRLADAYLLRVVKALAEEAPRGDIAGVIKHLGAIFPHLTVCLPFLSTAFFLNRGDRKLIDDLAPLAGSKEPRSVLWFTDTLGELNGVSETLGKTAWMALAHEKPLKLVACLEPEAMRRLPPNTLLLPVSQSFDAPFYPGLTLRLPSILASLKMLLAEPVDQVILSTPGPVGLLGLLFARMKGVPVHTVYHTDFTAQLEHLVGDRAISNLMESALKAFYHQSEVIRVPSPSYVKILGDRGWDTGRMRGFPRGMDLARFAPDEGARQKMKLQHNLQGGIQMLYTGRVSVDKNMPFLADLFERLAPEHRDLNLLVAGDGPWLLDMRRRLAEWPRVRFTGRLPRESLPTLYAGSDLLLFPSDTDTFGMTVFEAQACGLPALVSDQGGPREIIEPGVTGWVAPSRDLDAWARRITEFLRLRRDHPDLLTEMRQAARARIAHHGNWNRVLDELMGIPGERGSGSVAWVGSHQGEG